MPARTHPSRPWSTFLDPRRDRQCQRRQGYPTNLSNLSLLKFVVSGVEWIPSSRKRPADLILVEIPWPGTTGTDVARSELDLAFPVKLCPDDARSSIGPSFLLSVSASGHALTAQMIVLMAEWREGCNSDRHVVHMSIVTCPG